MQISLTFIRILFLGLCILFVTTYASAGASEDTYYQSVAIGIAAGFILGCAIISLDALFKRFNLRAFNTATIGLFFGYLMGEAILLIFQTVLDAAIIRFSPQTLVLIRMCVYLFSSYFGMVMTARASDELYVSIPFIKFKPNSQKKKDVLLDSSKLLDARIIDLASSGLLDSHLVIARFLIKEFSEMAESADENLRAKGRRGLDIIKKLEGIPSLDVRFAEADFPDNKDAMSKLVRLARLLEANILTADSNRIQQSSVEGIRIVNIHTLSSALKPLAQTGEFLNIKIQRYGKEPRQGVGYLDDGTMVVVNGGAEYIGEVIRSQVLSVKHTSSGRMVFCNVIEDGTYCDSMLSPTSIEAESAVAKTYFAL
jgi:uncharacterized protein YacL